MYHSWMKRNEQEPRLPGFAEYSPEQVRSKNAKCLLLKKNNHILDVLDQRWKHLVLKVPASCP